ncbi:MAG: hypothetical protein IT270_06205 [Saprospiraceae bacterium]|nr:hypothetical protein [Saprospiraceae bacterium]
MTNHDNLLSVFQTIYRWRKTIRNVCIAAAIGSVGISLLLKNYYQATTIFYPASPELANPELIFGFTSQVTNYFGSDRDLDRLAEIANSTEVVDFMVNKYRLYDHYDIDSTAKDGPHKVRKHFRKLYSALKNKNDAIELSIEDTDPQLAADMANTARNKINEIGQRLTKNSQAKLIETFEDNIKRKHADLTLIGDSLRNMQAKYNIFSAGAQGEQLSSQLAIAESEITHYRAKLEILEPNQNIPRDTIAYIKANLRAYQRERQQLMTNDPNSEQMTLKQYNEGLPLVSVLSDLHFQARKQLSYDLERYNQIKSAYNTDIPSLHLVEAAEIPRIKSRPKRSILVLVSVLAALIFTTLAALLAEAYRDINWEKITH